MRHRTTLGLMALVGLVATLLPRRAWAAGCGVQDLGACVDDAQYTFWYGLAALGWAIDRTLLLLAYQLDTLRWWLVQVAFTSAYDVLTQLVDPLIVPFASVAIIIGCLALLLLPVFGRMEVVKIRHALTWVVIAPVLLTLSGPLIVQTEQLRATFGTALFNGVSAIAPGSIFGVPGTDMAAVVPLYAASPCGVSLARPGAPDTLRMDDLAAALVFADVEDVHCGEAGGPDANVPDRFYDAAPDGPGYATAQAVGDMDNAAQRTAAVDAMQRGAIRTFLGMLPATLAVLDALVQLVFALCLVALWISLPIGLLFVFFAQTADPVTGLFRRAIGVLQVSWSSSVVLGMLFACLLAAAELRNATAYTGFAIGAAVLTGYILVVAVDTLKSCLRTLSDTVAVATGLNPAAAAEQVGGMAATVAGLGVAAASGGAGLALAGAVAAKQTGSGRYAAGAMLGQFAPIARVGEIAAAMGEGGELVSGTVAGGRSQRSGVRALAAIAAADGRRTDDAGLTFRDHAAERQVAHTVNRRPTIVEEVGAAMGGVRTTVQAAHTGALSAAVLNRGHEFGEAFHDRIGQVGDVWQRFSDEVEERSEGSLNPARVAAAGVTTLDRRLTHRGQAMSLDAERRTVTWSPRVAPAGLPEQVLTERRDRVRVPRLLTLGYTVQENDDGTLSFWKPAAEAPAAPEAAGAGRRRQPAASPPPASPAIAAAERRVALVEAGALLGNLTALRAELGQLRTAAATAAAAPAPTAAVVAIATTPTPVPGEVIPPVPPTQGAPTDPPEGTNL